MKSAYLSCLIAMTTLVHAAENHQDIETAVKRFYSDKGQSRVSARGDYIHHVFKKAVDVNDLLVGAEDWSPNRKNRLLRMMKNTYSIDYTLQEDENKYFIKRYYRSEDNVRRDIAGITKASAEEILDGGAYADKKYRVQAYNGVKTTSYEEVMTADGVKMVGDISKNKIRVPNFHRFGLRASTKEAVDIPSAHNV